MKKTMNKNDIIAKIAGIDATISENRFNRTLTPEQVAKLRSKRDRLEKMLYR